MERNYVTGPKHRLQHGFAHRKETLKKTPEFAREWERMQRSLEMDLNYRRQMQEYASIENYPIYKKFLKPRDFDEARTRAWRSEDEDAIPQLWMRNTNSSYSENMANDGRSTESEVLVPGNVLQNLTAAGRFLEMLQNLKLPRMSFTTVCIFFLLGIFISPRSCAQTFLFPVFRLSFGTLYPAYSSYKAVRTKNVKEYVKWMMYWIVYAFFTCIETFTDIFLSWFPFYYEVKVIIVLWLLSPATKGSSTLYRKFVHPMLTRREQEIDDYLNQAKERGYSAVIQLGSKGVNYATNVIMQTALKGGGNLVQTIKRSYSLSDLSEPDVHRTQDEIDEVVNKRPQHRMLRPRMQTAVGRSASGSRHSTGMYFTEVDVNPKGPADFNYSIRSSEDISSGYSSAEPISVGLSRTSSMTNASKARLKSKKSDAEELLFNILDTEEADNSQTYTNNAQFGIRPIYFVNNWIEDGFIDEAEFRRSRPKSFATQYEPMTSRSQYMLSSSVSNLEYKINENDSDVTLDDEFSDTLSGEKEIIEKPLQTNSTCFEQNELMKKAETSSINFDQDSKIAVSVTIDDDDDANYEEFLDTISTTSTKDMYESLDEATLSHSEDHEQQNMEVGDEKLAPLECNKITPKELKLALEEIKESFRINIDSTKQEALLQDDETQNTLKARHNKGKAPAPPPSDKPIDTLSVNSLTSSYSSVRASSPANEKSGIRKGNLFKNIKSNLFRTTENKNNQLTTDQRKNSLSSVHRETEI